jgi:hypothetical protein
MGEAELRTVQLWRRFTCAANRTHAGLSLPPARLSGPPEIVSVVAYSASRLNGAHGEILTLWSFRSPMGQRSSPAMRLTEPPMMTTPNRYDSKA